MARGRRSDRSKPGPAAGARPDSRRGDALPLYEDIEFDEDGDPAHRPAASDRQQPVLRTEDHAMSQPEDPRESTASYQDAPRVGSPSMSDQPLSTAEPPRRRGASGFFAGLIGGLLGSAVVIGAGGWYAYEHGPIKGALDRLAATEGSARNAETATARLGEQIGQLSNDIGGLRNTLQETSAVLGQLDQRLTGAEQRVAATEQRTGDLAANLEQASTSFRKAGEEVIGRLEAVNARLAEVARAQPADIVDKGTVQDIAAKQAGIEEAQRRLEGGLARLEQLVAQGLEAGNQQASALRVVVDNNRTQLDQVATQVGELLALREQLARQQEADTQQLAALQATNQQLTSMRGDLEQRLEQVTSRLSALDQQRERGVGMALAADSLDSAVQTGQPYQPALELLTQLGQGDQVVSEVIGKLQPAAAEGVPTHAELARQLEDIERSLTPPDQAQSDDWLERTRANLQGLVDLHPAGEEPVPGLNAVQAARGAMLLQDLEGALAALEPLAQQGNEQAAGWVAAARTRLEARNAVQTLRQHVKTLLARQD